MDIRQATKSYEQWMRQRTTIAESHLRYKHQQMKDDLFLFFRGTFHAGRSYGRNSAPIFATGWSPQLNKWPK